jgi:hypothetical protein
MFSLLPENLTRFASATVLLLASCNAGAAPDDGRTGGSPWFAAGVARVPAADATAGAELDTEETRISAAFGRLSLDSLTLHFGLDYEYTHYEYVGIDSRNRDLHRLQLPIHFDSDLGDWQLEGYIAPGISTSSNVMDDLFGLASGDDLIVTGRVRLQQTRAGRTWFAGIAHDRRFGKPRAYPVAGLEFDPKTNVHVRLAYPDPGVAIDISERQSIQADIYPAGHQWHVVSDDLLSDFNYRVEAWRGQLTWRLPLWRMLGLDISAGYEFGREHQFSSDAGAQLAIDIRDQWFIGAGFRMGAAPALKTHGAWL